MISIDLSEQFLFVLPLPLNKEGVNARLAGAYILRTDAYFNKISDIEFIPCALASHIIPSPAFLFTQGLDPHILVNGYTEEDFINKLKDQFKANNTNVITFSINHMQALNAAAFRLFDKESVLNKAHCILDLKQALKIATNFSDIKDLSKKNDLITKAKYFGFTEDIDKSDYFKKIEALVYLFKFLYKQNPKLVLFLLKKKQEKMQLINDAIANHKNLCYQTKEGKLLLIKPLLLKDDVVLAIAIDNKGSLQKIFIDLLDFELISPVNLITPKRAIDLDFAVDALQNTLNNLNVDDFIKNNKGTLPFRLLLKRRLNVDDLKHYENIASTEIKVSLDNNLSFSKLITLMLICYKADNHKDSLIDYELNYYNQYCLQVSSKIAPSFREECENILNNLSEDGEKNALLLKKIMLYFS